MATLTEISIASRKYVLWLIAVFIGYLILSPVFNLIIKSVKNTQPVSPPPADVRFNKIPAPKFPVATSSSGLQFVLENIEGRPPETTSAGRIYAMPKKLPTLLSAQRAKGFASQLGFSEEPEPVTSLYFRFTDPADTLRTLELDAVNLNFKLGYNYQQNPLIVSQDPISNKNQPLSEVTSFIERYGLFDDSILKGKTESEYLTFDPKSLSITKASSLTVTNMVRINFFREDINGFRVLPPGFNKSHIYALYTPAADRNTNILGLVYTFWPVAFDDFATYPLKNSAEAWRDLEDGYAYIINLGNNLEDKPIVIREIYLAYYDSEEPQRYLQPIFVFEGDNDFVAYLPAISPDWLK